MVERVGLDVQLEGRHFDGEIRMNHHLPELGRLWNRFTGSVWSSWRVDETYLKFRGEWVYLYGAVDREATDRRLSSRHLARSYCGQNLLPQWVQTVQGHGDHNRRNRAACQAHRRWFNLSRLHLED
jgi:hypothetical protein